MPTVRPCSSASKWLIRGPPDRRRNRTRSVGSPSLLNTFNILVGAAPRNRSSELARCSALPRYSSRVAFAKWRTVRELIASSQAISVHERPRASRLCPNQSDQRVPAGRHTQLRGQSGPGPTGQGKADRGQTIGQRCGAPRERRCQTRYLLGAQLLHPAAGRVKDSVQPLIAAVTLV